MPMFQASDLTALPITHRAVIPDAYLDEMGHMNVMWYTHLFSMGAWGLFQMVGLNRAYFDPDEGCKVGSPRG